MCVLLLLQSGRPLAAEIRIMFAGFRVGLNYVCLLLFSSVYVYVCVDASGVQVRSSAL